MAMDYHGNMGMAKRSGVTIRGNCCDTRNKLQLETIPWMLASMDSLSATFPRIVLSAATPSNPPVAMAAPVGPPATTSCEPRQARKGAAAAADSGAGERWAGVATNPSVIITSSWALRVIVTVLIGCLIRNRVT